MNKIKTRHSARKRFRQTTKQNFIRKKAFKSHLLEKKSAQKKRKLSLLTKSPKYYTGTLHRMIPYA